VTKKVRDPFNKMFANVKQCAEFKKDGVWKVSSKTNRERMAGKGAWSGKWKPARLHIDKEDLVDIWERQNGRCYWFDIPIDLDLIYVNHHPLAPSTDRLNDNADYTLKNSVICCRFANLGRNTFPEPLWRECVKYIKKAIVSAPEFTLRPNEVKQILKKMGITC